MPKKVVPLSLLEQDALDALTRLGKDDVTDWTAQVAVDWQALLGGLVAADCGVMFRSADQGRALAVGLFAGGAPVWQTCRDVSEFGAYMDAVVATLETIAGGRKAGRPTPKGRAQRKRS